MEMFRPAIHDCGLIEVLVLGSKFTWHRGRGVDVIFERLDRFMVFENWFDFFTYTFKSHIVETTFVHYPVLLEFSGVAVLKFGVKNR